MASAAIPDKVAKRLWLITALTIVSAYPLAALATTDYLAWSPDVAKQVADALVVWAGGVAATLGLSRYAPSNSTKVESPPTGS